jgi:hypothetical protein
MLPQAHRSQSVHRCMFDGRDDGESATLESEHDALCFRVVLDGDRKVQIPRESRFCSCRYGEASNERERSVVRKAVHERAQRLDELGHRGRLGHSTST